MDQSSALVESRLRLRQKRAKCRAAAQEWRGVFEAGVYRRLPDAGKRSDYLSSSCTTRKQWLSMYIDS